MSQLQKTDNERPCWDFIYSSMANRYQEHKASYASKLNKIFFLFKKGKASTLVPMEITRCQNFYEIVYRD